MSEPYIHRQLVITNGQRKLKYGTKKSVWRPSVAVALDLEDEDMLVLVEAVALALKQRGFTVQHQVSASSTWVDV